MVQLRSDKACNKKSFLTRAEAKRFANANRKRNGTQRAYLCHEDPEHQRGGIWHLTGMSANHTAWYKDDRARRRKK